MLKKNSLTAFPHHGRDFWIFESLTIIPNYCIFKGNGYISRGDNSIKIFYLPSENGIFLKGKNLLPAAANRPLLRRGLFKKANRKSKKRYTYIYINGGKIRVYKM